MTTQPLLFVDSSDGITRSAVLSPCGRYRYSLTRVWKPSLPRAGWICLNPSTADASKDDPTIRRLVAFAKAWGCGGIEVVNLFAWRATDPRELLRHPGPVGPDNDRYILEAAATCRPLVAAWGVHGVMTLRDQSVRELLAGTPLSCLGTTKNGHPRHPLYCRADVALVPFTPA